MLWIVKDEESYQITACNVHKVTSKEWETWVTRTTGKNVKIFSGDEGEAKLIKSAIEYAIQNGDSILRL